MRKIKKYIPYIILLIAMIVIHQYVHLYADDYYYSRDAKTGFENYNRFALKELKTNGRVWVHFLLMLLIRYDALIFRIVNPIVITFGVYLLVKIAREFNFEKKKNGQIIIGILAVMLFIGMPKEIVVTTLYYPACALNYLYPSIVALWFGYTIYKEHNEKGYSRINIKAILLGLLAGSSTQQAGMMSIGFSVIKLIDIKLIKKQRASFKYYISLIMPFIGYIFVSYGSVRRMLFEKSSGVEVSIIETLVNLLRTNIFSKAVFIYVILMLISFIFNILMNLKKSKNKGLNYIHLFILIISTILYSYVAIFSSYDISRVVIGETNIILIGYYVIFTMVYVFYGLYCGIDIYLKSKNFFILACLINSIGSQAMLLVADARFASAYKIIFPSLMFNFVFILYSFIKFYNYKGRNEKVKNVTIILIIGVFSVIGLRNYYNNYKGYKRTSINIDYNLEKIKEYKEKNGKETEEVLKLKRVELSGYGYNLGNWNDMPYFMKQCYGISEDIQIEYIK